MKNHIFLQARVNSKRFPGKILQKILGKTIIELIVERLRKIKNINQIILVTGPEEKNHLLIEEARRLNLDIFCGSEENILDRFYEASKKFGSDIIIRVTGDCPVIDFNVINKGVQLFSENKYDVLTITQKRTFPDGFDFEIFKKEALHTSWRDILSNFESREKFCETFINPIEYMIQNNKFKKFNLVNEVDYSNIRLTIDYPADLEFITIIYEKLYNGGKLFALNEILNLLKKNPELLKINQKSKFSKN